MAIEYFCCYHSYKRKCEKLTDQELGRLFRALLNYSETGEAQELTGRESIAFDFIADDIDRSKQAYEERCQTNAENGKLGGRPKKTERLSEKPNGFFENPTKPKKPKTNTKTNTKANTKENISPPVSPPRGNTRFVPPTLGEVEAYCSERGNGISAQSFIDYYSARGWKLGKESMKDWKAAVRTWENRRRGKNSEQGSNIFLELYNERRSANDI